MNNGFITIHRKLFDSYLASSPYRVALWVRLIAMASHKDREFIFNGAKTIVKRGQLITGRKRLALLVGMSESYVQKLLKEFEKYAMLEQQICTTSRLITIVKYAEYQGSNIYVLEGVTAERQRSDTYNNVNNETSNKLRSSSFKPPLLTDVNEYIHTKQLKWVDGVQFFHHYEANGWKVGRNVMKNWKAALSGWNARNKPQKVSTEDYLKGKEML